MLEATSQHQSSEVFYQICPQVRPGQIEGYLFEKYSIVGTLANKCGVDTIRIEIRGSFSIQQCGIMQEL